MGERTDRGVREKMEVIMGRLKETRVVVGDGIYVCSLSGREDEGLREYR